MRRIKARYIDGKGEDDASATAEKSKRSVKKNYGKGKRKNEGNEGDGDEEVKPAQIKVTTKKATLEKDTDLDNAEEV
jgi:hypothetical protein